MKCAKKTYVTFEFSPAFISEAQDRERGFYIEEYEITLPQLEIPVPNLEPGTLDRVLEQYEEVMVPNSRERELSKLEVPKGAFRFYFYDRLIATSTDPNHCYENGEPIEMRSEEIDQSEWYYLEAEGDLVTRKGLKRGEGFHPQFPEDGDYLLQKMDDHNCNRLFRVNGSANSLPLEAEEMVLKSDQVQMIDTEIPWPSD